MDRKKLMSRIMPIVVAGSVLLSTGGFVYAQTTAKTANNKSMSQMKNKDSQKNIKSKLDALVKSSVITQDQETKVLDFMKQKDTERKAEMDKVKNMSEADRKAYFENNKKDKVNLADELVKAGIVSQDQANSIVNAMKPAQGDKQHKENGNKMKSVLDNLVKSSTITQDQENKILDFMKQKNAERKAEMDKVKNMSEADRKAYFENNKKEKTDLLADLVKSGVITQDQANSIKQSMPTPKDGHMKKDVNKN